MNNLNFKNITEDLLEIFLKAGEIAKEISKRGVKITIKADNTPVTDGDIAIDKLLKEKIKTITSNIPIISEETVDLKQNVKIKRSKRLRNKTMRTKENQATKKNQNIGNETKRRKPKRN